MKSCSMGILLALVIYAGGCRGTEIASSTEHFPEQTGFVQRQVVVDGTTRGYWVFIPPGYQRNRLYPAILFLHGLFEQGNGGANVLSAGLGPVIARAPERWPFVTVFPQSTGTWSGAEREQLAMAALKDVERHYLIDSSRVILAGLSYGGLGVWEIGAKNRNRFAGLVPVSGQRAPDLADALKSTPVWAFASESDIIVNADNSVEMCRVIQSHGGRARLTQFKGGEHDCWAQAVDQSELVNWMLTQRRGLTDFTASASGGTPTQASGRLRSLSDR